MDFLPPLVGFAVGYVVGATGIGGGLLLLPALILVLHVSPVVSVGTALVFMFLTKTFAVAFHWKQKTVDFNLAAHLAMGSIPGVLIGSITLAFFYSQLGNRLNELLGKFIGLSLIVIASLLLVFEFLQNRHDLALQSRMSATSEHKHAIWIGLVCGFLVGVTSIGSGSLIILLLLVFCPRRPAVLVGTDIFHALILTGIASAFQSLNGRVDFHLVAHLLIGSIAGAFLGTRLTLGMPPILLRRGLLVLAAAAGVLMV